VPAGRPATTPNGHGDGGLPGHCPSQLGPGKAQGLEQGQVAAPAPHRCHQGQAQSNHGTQGQAAGQQVGGGARRAVVLDLGGELHAQNVHVLTVVVLGRQVLEGLGAHICDMAERCQPGCHAGPGPQADEHLSRAVERGERRLGGLSESERLHGTGDYGNHRGHVERVSRPPGQFGNYLPFDRRYPTRSVNES
jgi:hypothetical protein